MPTDLYFNGTAWPGRTGDSMYGTWWNQIKPPAGASYTLDKNWGARVAENSAKVRGYSGYGTIGIDGTVRVTFKQAFGNMPLIDVWSITDRLYLKSGVVQGIGADSIGAYVIQDGFPTFQTRPEGGFVTGLKFPIIIISDIQLGYFDATAFFGIQYDNDGNIVGPYTQKTLAPFYWHAFGY